MSINSLVSDLKKVVGDKYVITDPTKNEMYRTGFRFGTGKALAVVRPNTLLEYWQTLKLCVAADVIIISQAANTGITGGSTPFGDDYDRDIVIINTMRIKGIQTIRNAEQVVCLAGSRLNELEDLLKQYNREPHSVLGSSCIGASIIGGVCNNSGGSLIQRGPAYTEMALYAQLDENGELKLVNKLGIELGNTPEEILTNLQQQNYQPMDVQLNCGHGHDHDYCNHVREIDADTPARFNADPHRHFDVSGSAGKLGVFAVRLDTFPAESETATFYIGTNNTHAFTEIRRHILANFQNLPILGEYIHREAFDIAEVYGKDTYWVIKNLGTQYLPKLFSLKAKVDRIAKKVPFLPEYFSDKTMQVLSHLIPQHLPAKFKEYRDEFEHHLILKMGGRRGIEEARQFLREFFKDTNNGKYFECSPKEAEAAMLHRFAIGAAEVRYRAVHTKEVEEIVALDVALPRNELDWFQKLPDNITDKLVHKIYCAHFLCHVFHQDYLIKKGYNWEEVEHEMLKILDQRGAKYPAEHNVGHLYEAAPELKSFYKQLDPTNSFNVGIGHTSKKKYWQ
ncbi:D-lactate dehydrogenase [Otariodibacter oris]|uniref:Quinone-dependent D-lactate dehydrogenase n=1 Tax=Otariodibacter oris TaxID=1032623 RepID=A0A420XGR2_9PAST|nr:D-lactate dehydrogenase [Otariodibacter oris]QGM81157.1 D-lactate dehydrogenase [Otariodibacter oris]RKR72710.1 D-lactate dehydrogenase [Otariodibacter oris]